MYGQQTRPECNTLTDVIFYQLTSFHPGGDSTGSAPGKPGAGGAGPEAGVESGTAGTGSGAGASGSGKTGAGGSCLAAMLLSFTTLPCTSACRRRQHGLGQGTRSFC